MSSCTPTKHDGRAVLSAVAELLVINHLRGLHVSRFNINFVINDTDSRYNREKRKKKTSSSLAVTLRWQDSNMT